ncbi:MAG: tryptophan synthase subunit alpha [Ferruginibacter sp.]|nr:tryptophan synthase subunit alpha [Ferruginibacter sp.]
MSRIKKTFEKKNNRILNVYFTAGYPHLESTTEIIRSLQENGADLIEIGMPYSDPLADGETIQQSGAVALSNGMTIKKLFEQLKGYREFFHLPIILMGYMNPVLQYGFEKFCADAASVGVSGLILPDLPPHEFREVYGDIIKKYGLDFIFLVTPETSEERIRMLDKLSSGFIYAVSSSSTTGGKTDIDNVAKYLQRLKSYHLTNPILVGFGIKDKASFDAVCNHADGGIIGSAYINALKNATDISATTKAFLNEILNDK